MYSNPTTTPFPKCSPFVSKYGQEYKTVKEIRQNPDFNKTMRVESP